MHKINDYTKSREAFAHAVKVIPSGIYGPYLPGGGLRVVNTEGKEFKFSFKHKKDFKIIWDYLSENVKKA